MSENRCSCGSSPNAQKETVCIDTYRVLDSCRDRDCYEDIRVYLTDFGQDIIERTSSVRAKSAAVCACGIVVEPIRFNRGFYQILITFYIKVTCEACVAPGRLQEFDGISVIEKRVILYGSEGSVSIFKSDPDAAYCSKAALCDGENSLPTAVVQTVSPICLSCKVVPGSCGCRCRCSCEDIPENVSSLLGGGLVDRRDANKLVVSLGMFTVVRIERPAQLLISAAEYSVPDKECVEAEEDNPCSLFRNMAFPTSEFSPPTLSDIVGERRPRGCCGDNREN